MARAAFTFIDLFAGIGGFHAAMSALGGKCVYASEIDKNAAAIYRKNWGLDPLGDITKDANDEVMNVPPHDVLCAGFPCQPFSKSGAQRGMEETRGTLYWNILKIIETHKPKVVLLENVRNLYGPRHMHEWEVIIETLREQGYRVSDRPAVFSPHLLPPDRGGRPQVRERVFITASLVGPEATADEKTAEPAVENRAVGGWDPTTWHLESDLPLDANHHVEGCDLSNSERLWLDAWDDFVTGMWELREGRRLPGFPLWADDWRMPAELDAMLAEMELAGEPAPPKWKRNFLVKNSEFYAAHKRFIDRWTKKWGVYTDAFPPSRRKLEWQAQDTPRLWDCVIHLRPSGIRAKAPTYLPALVAITQTSIIGPRDRRLSPREAARLQGLPDWFSFSGQSNGATYKQLGNGVSVGAVWHVIREHVKRDEEFLKKSCPGLANKVMAAPPGPDAVLRTIH